MNRNSFIGNLLLLVVMEQLKAILSEIGLSSYKIETYISLLKIKSGTVQQIAKSSTVPSCKIYESLKWLHENGYISMISQKPLAYRANNPKSVINSEIEKNKEKLDKLKNELETVDINLPVAEKDIVQITSTREAYFKKMKEFAGNVKKSIVYTARHWKVDAELIRLLQEKIKQGVQIRGIGPVSSKEEKNISWLKEIGVKIKKAELEETHFAVYDNSFVVISLRKEPEKSDYNSIFIKSETLAEILTNHFNSIWKKV